MIGHPVVQRQDVFSDRGRVADHDGISAIEHRALGEIATALQVDEAALLQIARVHTAA